MSDSRPFLPRLLAAALLLALPLVLLHRALFCGEAFLPADLLAYVAPWSHGATASPTTAWNVLRYDGVTQFYPWRLLAARAIQSGHLPLWNPFAFAAAGGAPLLADSQSAPLYPLNLLFFDLLPPGSLWYAFGLSACAHLTIAGTGLYRFLRALRLRRAAALLGGATFALSGPVVTFLALPTFLAVACWIPYLLLAILDAHQHIGDRRRVRRAIVGAALCVGLMLLGGHLQIALYGMLMGGLYALTLGIGARRGGQLHFGRWAAGAMGVVLAGVLLALPQLLPAVELSHVSHRAGNDQPYEGYIATALPPRNLVTLLEPDFFGHPNPPGTPYWNTPRSNYAEWSLYAGVAPLLLAGFAMGLPWRRLRQVGSEDTGDSAPLPFPCRERTFFAAAALFALLIALGTSLNTLLFYGVPGFRATGSPARILVLFALSIAVLAAIGLDALLRAELPKATKERAALIGLAAPLLITAVGASQAAQFQAATLPGTTLASLLAPVQTSLLVGVAFIVVSGGALLAFAGARRPPRADVTGAVFLGLATADLLLRGYGYNPTVPPTQVYPVTPGIAYLQQNARVNDLIAPVNRNWSMTKEQVPRGAVLPPNALTVYGLHDIAGYDSLFPGAAKTQLRDASPIGEDPSPPENGNMLFVKRTETAIAAGARYLVFAPEYAPAALPPPLHRVYSGDDLTIWKNPAAGRFDASVGRAYKPASLRVGIFGMLAALGAAAALAGAKQWGEGRGARPRN